MDWVLGSHAGLSSLLDRLLDDHVYAVGGWAQINQNLVVAQTQFHQNAPNKLFDAFRTSGSECLLLEVQTQERRRFYNASARQQRAPRFTGEGRRYVTVVPIFFSGSLISLPTSSNLTRQWRLVTISPALRLSLIFPRIWCQRSEHTIDDELVFSNHTGYVFHDSRGIESGSTEELEVLKEFIHRKCGERRLRDKLHAIWFGLPSS